MSLRALVLRYWNWKEQNSADENTVKLRMRKIWVVWFISQDKTLQKAIYKCKTWDCSLHLGNGSRSAGSVVWFVPQYLTVTALVTDIQQDASLFRQGSSHHPQHPATWGQDHNLITVMIVPPPKLVPGTDRKDPRSPLLSGFNSLNSAKAEHLHLLGIPAWKLQARQNESGYL